MDTQQRILDAARELFLSEGLPGLTMRRVARATGLSATAIYRHFDNKETLMAAVAARGSHLFFDYLSRGLEGADARERLRLSGAGYLDFSLENPAYYRILFMTPLDEVGFPTLGEKNTATFAPTFQYLQDRVRECMDENVLASADVDAVSAVIWAQCHGVVSLYLAGHFDGLGSREAVRAFFQSSLDALLRGLAA
jgi:AcrR family transcriptional regulator